MTPAFETAANRFGWDGRSDWIRTNMGTAMYYKNGRAAKNGDRIIIVDGYQAGAAGILYNSVPGNGYCNGKIAPISAGDPTPNLSQCLRLDDVLDAAKGVPDAKDEERASPGIS